jgi:hypothetical protein
MKSRAMLRNQIIFCHSNITILVLPNKDILNKQLKRIEIRFRKHVGHTKRQKERYRGYEVMIRLNVYSRKNDSLNELLYTSQPVSVGAGENDEFNLEVDNVRFLEGGFYLQLEHLGSVDSTGSFVDCDGLHLIRPEIADTKSKEYDIVSYLPASVGKVCLNESLNYEKLLMSNGEKGDYYLNYRFSYYE